MVKAMSDCELPSLPCTASTLKLVVYECLLSQSSAAEAVAVGRKIVGHFKQKQALGIFVSCAPKILS